MITMIIADDESVIRQGLISIDWQSQEIQVERLCSNGLEALDAARQIRPHIVLTDVRMPGMDGLELARVLKDELPDIRIVLLTGYSEFSFAFTALQLGVAGFILKPTNAESMMSSILKVKKLIEDEEQRDQYAIELERQVRETQTMLYGKPVAEPAAPVPNETTEKLLRYINEHYMENVTLMALGCHVNMSPVYLSRLLRKVTGETFLDILTKVRLAKAVELLRDPRIKTYEIADEVGIHDARYFGQVFKKVYGITPSEFRKRQRGVW